jgi:hypothetical protein
LVPCYNDSMIYLETKNGQMVKSLETLYEEFIDGYIQGNFIEGVCSWNGDDALMGPRSFSHKFKKEASKLGFGYEEYIGFANELEEWCQSYLGNLEMKFR